MDSLPERDKKGTAESAPDSDVERERLKAIVQDGRREFEALLENARSKGIDPVELLSGWTFRFVNGLPLGAKNDFVELCSHGCHAITLAGLSLLVRISPGLQVVTDVLAGPADQRLANAKKLEKAAGALEAALTEFSTTFEQGELERLGRVHPQRVISEMRSHAQMMMFPSMAAEFTRAHSPIEFSRYLLTCYVERATGKPHDGTVSGLIAGLCEDLSECSEDIQKSWRHRNWERLDPKLSFWVDYILAIEGALEIKT